MAYFPPSPTTFSYLFSYYLFFFQVIDEIVDAEVCDVAKAARAILLKSMDGEVEGDEQGEHSSIAAPVKAVGSVINPLNLEAEVVQKELFVVVQACVTAQPVLTMEGLSIEEKDGSQPVSESPPTTNTSTEATAIVTKTICEYISKMAAQLIVYGAPLNPSIPPDEELNPADKWKYSLAMTEPNYWKDCVVPYVATLKLNRQRIPGKNCL